VVLSLLFSSIVRAPVHERSNLLGDQSDKKNYHGCAEKQDTHVCKSVLRPERVSIVRYAGGKECHAGRRKKL
jgi:hypothetical protein